MNYKNITIGVLIVAVLGVLGFSSRNEPEPTPTPTPVERPTAAVSSPDFSSTYIGVGGLRRIHLGANLSSSSTACTLSPDFGTTTVEILTFQTVGTSTITKLVIAKATNDTNATTTALVSEVVFAANIKGTLYAATSTDMATTTFALDGDWTLGPDDVLNFDIQGLVSAGEAVEGASSSSIPGLRDLNGWQLGTCGATLLVH